MRYRDIIYGPIDIPEEIWKLFGDPLLVRLRGISQAVLPVEMNPFATAANRFQHGVGVWHLARRLCERSEFKHLDSLLPLAGLLHDAGSPPFSHTGEWFMRDAIGHDGETHLREVLRGTELASALEALGADPERIADFVEGKAKPWSDLLNGSLDLDNLDNIRRFAASCGIPAKYDPLVLAASFRVSPDGEAVALDAASRQHLLEWHIARKGVYESVYDEPHLPLGMMLHRAIELAHLAGELPQTFWRLTDQEAFQHLERCNEGTQALVRNVRRLQPYRLVAEWSGHDSLDIPWGDWRIRKAVGDEIAEFAGVQPGEACAYLGAGKDWRNVPLPFRDGDRLEFDPGGDSFPVYRIKIYLRRAPSRLAKLALRNLPEFCRLAISHRMIRPISLRPAAPIAPAGF
ncbi:MAG: hypothetical protein A3B37_00475 [Candidatus Sungbacteria bacterium RIFCSPLOWO2_01_FULL_59_16]|uniref:HD/PDEase domain-containing protein n=1 Tax=Candidatus Sungbacteria bacterium RIFCSPLOWO2_01_FULL_59_16 TaxID=1802280 RepID=A0A1G2LDA4_9BACT|nr:MAG: hypothetical protein A3B37_00475 [Candidatus Sungbacteria bacterium RIFCSPLOWO2_01_FULL_59_16]